MKKRFLIFVTVLLIASLLFGCSKPENAGDITEQEPTSTSEKHDEVTIGLTADPANFSPLHSTMMIELRVYENFYDCLVSVDENGNYQGELAEDWTVSDDGLKYTFNIRKGVKFHNGDELKASDVAYTFAQYKLSPNYHDIAILYNKAKATGEYTFEVELVEPSAMFLAHIASQGYIFNEKVLKEIGEEIGSKPMGTGPYKLVSRELGSKITLERFEDYFKGPAPIKTVNYRILPDENTLVIALEAGDIDYADNIPLASKSTLEGNDKIELITLPGIRVEWVAMNNEKAPFDNTKVRQAVNYALNREFLNDVVYEGEAFPLDILCLPTMVAAPDSYPKYEYNLEKAKTLMAEAGYPNGFKLDQPILCSTGNAKIAEVLQANLSDIGIEANIDAMEFSAFIDRKQKGDFSIAISGYYMITLDTDLALNQYKTELIGSFNDARYSNPKVDELMLKAVCINDVNERRKLYNEIYTILQNDAAYAVCIMPAAVIAHNTELIVNNPNSRNVRLNNLSWK